MAVKLRRKLSGALLFIQIEYRISLGHTIYLSEKQLSLCLTSRRNRAVVSKHFHIPTPSRPHPAHSQ